MASLQRPRSQPKRVRPPRKSTIKRRNEERTALRQEIETLVTVLRQRHVRHDNVPTTPPQRATDAAPHELYARLHQAEMDHDLWIAGLRGFLRSYETTQRRPPLHVPLVLTADPAERRQALWQHHASKIRDARAFIQRQCGTLDLSQPYISFEKSHNPGTGIHTMMTLEIAQFPGVHSVHRVFDAMRFWMSNVEICITERLGSLTIREDDEDDGTTDNGDAYSSLRRVRSTLECGVPIEGNFAIFRQLLDAEECAVLTIQPVDDDPLYPFQPDEKVRVEIHGAGWVSKPSSGSGVVFARWATLQLICSTDRVATPAQAAAMTDDAARWFQVLHQVLRERVYASENQSSGAGLG